MSELKLTDVEWGDLLFSEIFPEIFIAKSSDSNVLTQGEVPFIGRSSVNNGFQGLYCVPEMKIIKKNCITVSMVGEPRAFYQPYDFTCSQNILILRNDVLNKERGEFLVTIINNYLISKGFGYGYPVGLNRVKKNKLKIPITFQREPNWNFMESYIKQEQKKQAFKLKDYYESKFYQLAGELAGLEEVEWKEFRFTDVFTKIQRGKRLAKNQHTTGKKPYVSSTSMNNGLDGFIGNNEKIREFEDCLTVANSGSVGSSFYHQYKFIASDHVTCLKNEQFSKEIYLFLSTLVQRLEQKYSFNREINDTRISREKILLPIAANGQPNWQYMSDFVKKIELDKVEKILSNIYIYI